MKLFSKRYGPDQSELLNVSMSIRIHFGGFEK